LQKLRDAALRKRDMMIVVVPIRSTNVSDVRPHETNATGAFQHAHHFFDAGIDRRLVWQMLEKIRRKYQIDRLVREKPQFMRGDDMRFDATRRVSWQLGIQVHGNPPRPRNVIDELAAASADIQYRRRRRRIAREVAATENTPHALLCPLLVSGEPTLVQGAEPAPLTARRTHVKPRWTWASQGRSLIGAAPHPCHRGCLARERLPMGSLRPAPDPASFRTGR